MKANEVPDKYKTCDWSPNYEFIGLTKEHIKRLNNAINILESLNEHTDAKYLKEIKDKLLEMKEVDLKKEINEAIHNYKLNNHMHTSICSADIEWIGEHFFNLGVKAQKG